jgi:hypothetical protein|tara:strand:- start:276 stop:449 length:174 start_codon:yes stop_codon:yes gene_type:complete
MEQRENKNNLETAVISREKIISKSLHEQIVSTLNEQLYNAYKRINELVKERDKLKNG